MAGRPLGAYDVENVRNEAGVDPFTTYVRNGMNPQNFFGGNPMMPSASPIGTPNSNPANLMAGGGANPTAPNPSALMQLFQLLMPMMRQNSNQFGSSPMMTSGGSNNIAPLMQLLQFLGGV